MEEARLGRWNLYELVGSEVWLLAVEMEEARLGRWNLFFIIVSSSFSFVEMEEARLGRWNTHFRLHTPSLINK